MAQEAPLQLVRVVRRGEAWCFEVCEEAAGVLQAQAQRRFAVCTVCGPYRTGKSYLLNLLLGRIQRDASQFRVGSTTRACTEGLWMWGTGDGHVDGTNILFVDCEGFGSTESDKVRDAKLMSLCLLISSVFVLNTKGVLNEGLFNALSLVCSMAEYIDDQGTGVQDGKPVLMWLLRDFLLELRDDQDRPLSPDEYLERALHTKPLAGVDAQRSQASREVRENLLRFFPQRNCTTLVQPVIDEDRLQDLASIPYQELRPDFRGAFEAAQAKLLGFARAAPKTVGGEPLTGPALVALLRRLTEALNGDAALDIGGAWEQVQHSACEALARELREQAAGVARQAKEGGPLPPPSGQPLPVRDDVLARALKELRRGLHEEWRARALGDEAVRAEYWRELRGDLAEQEQALEQLNVRLAEEQLRVAGGDWDAWLTQEGEAAAADPRSEALPLLLDRGLPGRPAARAAQEALHLARMARIRWDASNDTLKAELRLVSAELASKAAAIQAAGRLDDAALEQTREAGRLQGQVDALQGQAREALQRERGLREQALEAEEACRKEQRSQAEAARKCKDLEEEIRRLEAQVAGLKAAEKARREEAVAQASRAKERQPKPKCGCSVM